MAKKTNNRKNNSGDGLALVNRLIKRIDKLIDESRKERKEMREMMTQFAQEAAEDRKILINILTTMNASMRLIGENSARTNVALSEMNQKLDRIEKNTSWLKPDGGGEGQG